MRQLSDQNNIIKQRSRGGGWVAVFPFVYSPMGGPANSATAKRAKVQMVFAKMGQYTVLLGIVSSAATIWCRHFAIECIWSTLDPLHQDGLSALVFGLNCSQCGPLQGSGPRLVPKSSWSHLLGCGRRCGNVGGRSLCSWRRYLVGVHGRMGYTFA